MGYVFTEAPRLYEVVKVEVTTNAQDIGTADKQCHVFVNSGTVYITGVGTADSNDMPYTAGSSWEMTGKVSVVAVSTADIRLQYYN